MPKAHGASTECSKSRGALWPTAAVCTAYQLVNPAPGPKPAPPLPPRFCITRSSLSRALRRILLISSDRSVSFRSASLSFSRSASSSAS